MEIIFSIEYFHILDGEILLGLQKIFIKYIFEKTCLKQAIPSRDAGKV